MLGADPRRSADDARGGVPASACTSTTTASSTGTIGRWRAWRCWPTTTRIGGRRSSAAACSAARPASAFRPVKLLDFAAHEAMLEASANPFAEVVLAHLKARETHGDPADRHAWKIRLVRGLYERGFSPKDVRELFRVIDWLMELPPPLVNSVSGKRWTRFKRRNVCHSSPVLSASVIRKGLRKGIEALLQRALRRRGAQADARDPGDSRRREAGSDPQSPRNRGQPRGSAPAMVAGNALSRT